MTPPLQTIDRRRAWLPWSLALVSFLPLLWCRHDFQGMFWFGDEWDQLDQISRQGFWHWSFRCFGENFAPVLKMTWGALALGSHGSYLGVLVAVWCVHACCIILLGFWMRASGFGSLATAFVLLGFGLAVTNVETLGWSIQLITVQGMAFFLGAAWWHHARERDGDWTPGALILFALLLVLSTFSFVRGPLAGVALAGATILFPSQGRGRRSARWLVTAVCLIPAAISVAVVMTIAPGNQHHPFAAGIREPALFAASYYLLNPAYKFVTESAWTTPTLLLCGAGKIAVLACGWRAASSSQRRLLLPLFVFDFGNAVLMGIGRYNEPLITATSSRYQYISLICTLPFFGVLLETVLHAIPASTIVRRVSAALALAVATWVAMHNWPSVMSGWAEYRGRNTRYTVFQDPNPAPEGAIPGIPFLQTRRAKELVAQYHLH
ncbi:MAG TPA: hypothetical protein VHE61_18200 [Opitutaceae bacterium]|nr:hypothetical protein [Opitutaceae bacterium]